MSQAAPPRNTDFDVSGADGVRFVVVAVPLTAWQPFDTAAKRLAGYPCRWYVQACDQAGRLNEADLAYERAAAELDELRGLACS